MECPEEAEFKYTVEALEKAITENTKAIILNTPNNPTGTAYKEEDLKAMQKLKDSGMEVYTIPAEDIPLWQDATLEVRENFIRNTGDLGRQLVDQCLSAN